MNHRKLLSAVAALLISTTMLQAKDYIITEYGAANDTTKLSTEAIQHAIDDCSKAGGGRVVVPTGNYKTGTIILKSHVELYLEHGATLFGSTQLKDYKRLKPNYLSLRTQTETIQLIYAAEADDIAITGSGTIDGRGKGFAPFHRLP